MTKIRDRLAERGAKSYNLFKSTVFGPWLDIRSVDHDNHALNFLLFHQRNIKEGIGYDTPFTFDVGQHTIKLGRREFCLLSGLRFGKISLEHLEGVISSFMKRVFPQYSRLKGETLLEMLESQDFLHITDEDVVRVCLLIAADYVFMGQENRHVMVREFLALVDDFDAWNSFPWGEHMWQEFHERNFNVVSGKYEDHMKAYAARGKAYQAVYNLYGLSFVLKVSICSYRFSLVSA